MKQSHKTLLLWVLLIMIFLVIWNLLQPDRAPAAEVNYTDFLEMVEADRDKKLVGQRVEQFAFYAPEVTDRSVLVIEFDQSGIVGDTRYLTIYDGHAIDPVSRETPTEGKELTVMQQLLGNFGRLPTDPGNPNQSPF